MRYKLCILAFLFAITAQAVNPFMTESENALIEVTYKRKMITDTTSRDSRFFVDDAMLRVGKDLSLFCGSRSLWEDSISKVDYPAYAAVLRSAYEKDKKNFFFLGGKYWSYIYKDKANNKLKENDRFDSTHWSYEEDLMLPEWEISDTTKNCLGYECMMATTQFKGRKWIAWFAPDIPVSDGPWKLWGLPGLILEAHDQSHDYEFTPQSIRTSGVADVGYMWYTPKNEYMSVSRDKFFKEWRKSKLQNSAAKIKAAYGIPSSSPSQKTKLAYDREETDYPHE